jgi:hypothetical protein
MKMYSKTEKESILNKIENNRNLYELNGGMYEEHEPVLCMFTDKPVVHVYNDKHNKKIPIGWAVNVKLSNSEIITCIATHFTYDEEDIDQDTDDFIVS